MYCDVVVHTINLIVMRLVGAVWLKYQRVALLVVVFDAVFVIFAEYDHVAVI